MSWETPTAIGLEQLAEALLCELPDGLVACDTQGLIVFWNVGAERIFGFSSAEAVGRSLDIIIPERQRSRHWVAYEKTMRTGQSRYAAGDLMRVPATTRDGRRISIEFSITPLPGPDGRLDGVAAVIRDVTAAFEERKRLTQALAETQ